MRILNKITDAARQKFTLIGENGEVIPFLLYYSATQQCWNFDIGYGSFQANGLQLTVSPNMLRNYKNLLPFGLGCTSKDGFDPYYINDFTSGRISLYLINAAEVEEIEQALYV